MYGYYTYTTNYVTSSNIQSSKRKSVSKTLDYVGKKTTSKTIFPLPPIYIIQLGKQQVVINDVLMYF